MPDEEATRVRIRDAAFHELPSGADSEATLAAIATTAGVTTADVLDHFDSLAGVRRACDRHVVATIRDMKGGAIAANSTADPGFLAAAFAVAPPVVRYLAWAVATDGPEAADLFDELVEESVHLFALAEDHGLLTPSPDPAGRAAVVLAMQLGGIALHRHLGRALGRDLLQPDGLMALSLLSMDILTTGIFTPEAALDTANGLSEATSSASSAPSDGG